MAFGMLAISAIGTGAKLLNDRKAARNAADLNAANIQNMRLEANETIRKTKLSQEQTLGTTVARQGASGVSLKSESVTTFLDSMKENFKKDINWLETARDSNISIANKGSKSQIDQIKAGMWGTALGGIRGGYEAYKS